MRARIGLVLALAVLALPAQSQAYVVAGRPWPHHTITYFNADRQMAQAVAVAVSAWNTSGVHVRFVAAPRSRAHVLIRRLNPPIVGPAVEEGTCNGYADLGYEPGRIEHVDLSPGCRGLIISAAVTTHELGHIVGLNHALHGCATMTPIVWSGCGYPKQGWQYRCRFLWPDDLAGAIHLYGGHARLRPKFCTAFDAPGSPTGLKVDADNRGVTWHNPPAPRVALAGVDVPQLEAFVAVRKDSCPTSFSDAIAAALPVVVRTGQDQAARLQNPMPLTPGNWCYAVFVRDQYDRGGPAATATVTIPNQLPVASFSATPDVDACFMFSDTSTDADGRIQGWQWDFGAPDQPENTSASSSAYHCYQQSGTYTVTLTVTDDSGGKATATQQVTATAPQQGF